MSTIYEKSIRILNEKNNKIIPENLKKDITVYGVTGTLEEGIDTSGATATENDILLNKTAYVNGEKITGQVPYLDSYGTAYQYANINETNDKLQMSYTYNSNIAYLRNSELVFQANKSDVAAEIELTADKLKKDETVLGVTGTYEGSSGVKLFETEQQMQADPKAAENDLAIIRRTEVMALNANSKVSTIKLPATVTLSEPIEEGKVIWYDLRDENYTASVMFEYYDGELSIRVHTVQGITSYSYNTDDNLIYTLQDYNTDQIIELGSVVYNSYPEEWDGIIGYFIYVYVPYFGGLFEYTLNQEDTTAVHFLLISGLNIDSSSTITIKDNPYDSTYYATETLHSLANKINTDFNVQMYSGNYMPRFFLQDNELCFIMKANSYLFSGQLLIDTNFNPVGFYSNDLSIDGSIYVYRITNIETGTYELKNTYTGVRKNNESYVLVPNITSCAIGYAAYNGGTIAIDETVHIYDNGSIQSGYKTIQDMNVYKHIDLYLPAPTQFTLQSSDELLPGLTALGSKGVVTGTNEIYQNLDWTSIWKDYNMITEASTRDPHYINSLQVSAPIISYDHNCVNGEYILGYTDHGEGYSEYQASSGRSCVKINDNTYFVYTRDSNFGYHFRILTLNGTEQIWTEIENTTGLICTASLDVGIDYDENIIYIVQIISQKLCLFALNLNTNALSCILNMSHSLCTNNYVKTQLSIKNKAIYFDVNKLGIVKISFTGDVTTIYSRSQSYSYATSISDKYMIVLHDDSSHDEIYDMENDTFTGIKTRNRNYDALVTIGDKTYLFEQGINEVKVIENGAVTSTITIPNNYSFSQGISSYHKFPLVSNGIALVGSYMIDINNEIITTKGAFGPVALIYLKGLDNVYISPGFYTTYTTGIDIKLDGSGKYLAFSRGEIYVIRDIDHQKILTDYTLGEKVSPEDIEEAEKQLLDLFGEEEDENE